MKQFVGNCLEIYKHSHSRENIAGVPIQMEVFVTVISQFGLHVAHEGLQLHGCCEVSLDLELAAHEGSSRPHLPLEHVHHQMRVSRHRHVRFRVWGTLGTRPTPVFQIEQPMTRVLPVQDEMKGGVDLGGYLGVEGTHHIKHGCWSGVVAWGRGRGRGRG